MSVMILLNPVPAGGSAGVVDGSRSIIVGKHCFDVQLGHTPLEQSSSGGHWRGIEGSLQCRTDSAANFVGSVAARLNCTVPPKLAFNIVTEPHNAF